MTGSPTTAPSAPWSFQDSGTEILVFIDVSSGGSASFDVQIGGDSLSVRRIENTVSTNLLSVTQLYSTVDVAASDWELAPSKSSLTVRLKKLDPASVWPQLEAETVTEKAEIAPGDPLEARKSVEALLEAARAGDVEGFKGAAQRFDGSDLSGIKDANGHNALHFSASLGRTEFVRYLIFEEHFNPDTPDDAGDTPLALAAASGHRSTVLALLEAGASVTGAGIVAGKETPQPMHWAAQTGNFKILEELLEHGAPLDPACGTGTPLVWAVGAQQQECASFLLDKGANPDGHGTNGVSVCMLAAATGSNELLQRLIDMGANLNVPATGGVTPLHVAAEIGREDTVRILLKGGANANAREEAMSARPIDAAAEAQHREVVEVLLPCTTPAEGVEWTVDALLAEAATHAHTHEHGGGCCGHDHGHDDPEEEVVVPAPEEYDVEKAKVLKRAGDEAFVRGQFPAALEHYTGALRHNTSDHTLWANRSAAALRTGAFQDALLDARRARTVDPRYAKAHYREGCAAEALELWEDAAQAYFQGCRLDPQNIALAQAFNGVVQKARDAHQQAHAHAHAHSHLHDGSCSHHCAH